MAGGARRRGRARLVTLSSDLGAAYAAQMKAVLAQDLTPGLIVDLAQDLRPHAIGEGAFVVRAMARGFPRGSVHLVVVDPGVGGRREPVAVACADGSVLVGPNNGVLAPLAEALGGGRAYRIERARLRATPRVGTTFDGRDLFAPAAARLATGTAPSELGPPVRLVGAPPGGAVRTPGGADGSVVHVDRFGNLITDVPTAWVPRRAAGVEVRLARSRRRVPYVVSYEEAGRGRLIALGSSFGTLELAVTEGRAADRLGLTVGARLRLCWSMPAGRSSRETLRSGRPR